jgi:glycosyltransferase involved in cell wall biosynthesis
MTSNPLNIVCLEPYFGGSHRLFLDTLTAHSRHSISTVSMPARKWKWRMRGAAIYFTRDNTDWIQSHAKKRIDVILCTDMLAVNDLRALLPDTLWDVPILCYFHENQLTYPLQEFEERDYQYGMTNILSCLAAEAVWFNSAFHRDDFLTAAAALLAKMPDFVPKTVVPEIAAKSKVLYPPVLVTPVNRFGPGEKPPDEPLTLLWSHRWEYDKNPGPFFEALVRLQETGRPFRLVLVGEEFDRAPPDVSDLFTRLKPVIKHGGWVPDHQTYLEWLRKADIVVSSSIQENFGLAVIEAVLSGCQPLLPNRLVYPEIIPPELHERCLYPGDAALHERLAELIDGRGRLAGTELAGLQGSLANRFGRAALDAIDKALGQTARAH